MSVKVAATPITLYNLLGLVFLSPVAARRLLSRFLIVCLGDSERRVIMRRIRNDLHASTPNKSLPSAFARKHAFH